MQIGPTQRDAPRDRERARLRAAVPSRKRRALVAEGFRGKGSRAPMCSPSVVRVSPWACRQSGAGGWAERASRPRGRRRSADGRLTVPVAVGSIISVRIRSSLGKSVPALPWSAAFPVGVDCSGDARAAPWADRALAYSRRQAFTEPPVSAPGALIHPPLQAVRDGVAVLRRAADAPRGPSATRRRVCGRARRSRARSRAGACPGCRSRSLAARN